MAGDSAALGLINTSLMASTNSSKRPLPRSEVPGSELPQATRLPIRTATVMMLVATLLTMRSSLGQNRFYMCVWGGVLEAMYFRGSRMTSHLILERSRDGVASCGEFGTMTATTGGQQPEEQGREPTNCKCGGTVNISPSGEFFACFACGKSGDQLQLLMMLEDISFAEAVERLRPEEL